MTSFFTINQEKCKQDGICAAVCPIGIIRFKGGNGFPSPVKRAEELCMNCGHCVAVCPEGAFSLRAMKSEDCLPAKRELLPGAEVMEHFFQSRRSIRAFQKRTVERGILTRLIEIARYAPSGHNLQPVQWLVIEDPAEVRSLATLIVDGMRLLVKEKPEMAIPLHMDLAVASWERGDEVIFRGAPHVIVACASETPTAQTDCIIVLTHLELAAPCLGLGACWSGYFNLVAAFYPPVNLALGLPKGHQSFGGMMVGFPKYKYYRIPLRHEPKISWR